MRVPPLDEHRVLVTGSRNWTNRRAVERALTEVLSRLDCPPGQVVVVHGAARGLDTLAGAVAAELGMRTEAHPADWDRYRKAAGHRRNAEMVALGAVVCVAFPLGESRGTRGCMAMCERAGIPVWERAPLVTEGLASGATLPVPAG